MQSTPRTTTRLEKEISNMHATTAKHTATRRYKVQVRLYRQHQCNKIIHRLPSHLLNATTRTNIHVHDSCIHKHTHARTHARTHTLTHARTRACACMRAHTHTHARMHTRRQEKQHLALVLFIPQLWGGWGGGGRGRRMNIRLTFIG